MMKKPVLSINIPTYNRPEELARMLKSLLPQLTEEVEIVVRDDSTNLLSQEKFDKIIPPTGIAYQYFKGEKIGVDKASVFLLEKAKGEFVWFLSDDDELLDGAVAAVLKVIKEDPKLNLIWANYYYNTKDRPAIPNKPSEYFKDGSDVLETLVMNIGLISTQIYRREIGLTGIARAMKHEIGFGFVSTAVYIHVLTQTGNLYFLSGPYLLCHPTTTEEFQQIFDKNKKNEFFNIYGVSFYDIMQDFKDSFTKHSVRTILKANYASVWRGMLVAWIGGWDRPHGKIFKMFKYYWSFPEFWIALPIFLMPRWLNKFLYQLYQLFFFERKFVLFNSSRRTATNGKK